MVGRVLLPNDRPQLEELIRRNLSLGKRAVPQTLIEQRIAKLEKNLMPGGAVEIFGSFRDDHLVGSMTTFRWKTVPYYSLTSLITFNPEGSIQLFKVIYSSLFREILKAFEAERRYTFFYMTFPRGVQLKRISQGGRLLDTSRFLKVTERYEYVTEEIILPGRASEYEAFNTLAGGYQSDVPMWIRRASLRNEFRELASEEAYASTRYRSDI